MTAPVAVIGIRAHKEQQDDLDREQDTIEVEDHRGHCGECVSASDISAD